MQNLVGMMLRQISTERIILVTVLKLLLVDGRKVNSFLFFPLNCRVFVASALTYCLIFVFLVEWMVKGEWVAENFIVP